MARCGYTRSVYSAVTHLFSSFHDDDALRRNPLVSRHFDVCADLAVAAERVRALILSSIDRIVQAAPVHSVAIARRQRQILLRYDLEGATRFTVCDELGVTERQLYRDRRTASELLAMYLREAMPAEPSARASVAVAVDPAELALQKALRMHVLGATRNSREQAEAITRSPADAQWRVVALCMLAQHHTDCEDYSESVRLLQAAEQLLEEKSRKIGAVRVAGLRAFFEIGRARIYWATGEPKEALRLGRSGFDRFFLSQSNAFQPGDPAAQVLLRDVISSVALLVDSGDVTGADALLGETRRAIARMPNAPEYLELEWRTALARLQTLMSNDHETLAQDANETLSRAQRLGLPAQAADSALLGAWIAARRGDVNRARELQSAVLTFSQAHDSVWTRSVMFAGAALIERKIGTPQRALSLARSASSGFTRGTPGHAFSSYILARAQLACGFAEDALTAAREVVYANAPREYVRAAAQIVMAESSAVLGRSHAALRTRRRRGVAARALRSHLCNGRSQSASCAPCLALRLTFVPD